MTDLLRLEDRSPGRAGARRIFGARPIPRQATPFMAGLEGERVVGELLARLGPSWAVVHDVPGGVGGGRIDHVVVGRAGVFVVSSKVHRGEDVWVVHRMLRADGRTTDHLRDGRHDASVAARNLSAAVGRPVSVTPVVAVVGARRLTLRDRPQDVVVLDAYRLARWLRARPEVLSGEDVDQLAWAVRDPGTWTPGTTDADIPRDLVDRYEALIARCRSAQHVRTAWAVGTGAALAGLVARVLVG